MKSASKLLPLNEVLAGMSVANDLLDIHGKLILGQGTIVTGAILLSLLHRGIETMDVVAEKIAVPARDAELELRRLRLAKLFRRCGDGPADRQLFQYLMQYRLGVRHE